ncbi:membrane-associated phosphatase, PAP2_like_5 family [Geotalea daltonii FRC-32]|uniref:Membrane-associated phosphatase, PAP2_like_5 family n=1 Tax=Geotalea daltonii (strain DSM 22248 / JCM 15807 / FRC-32) TaxID=316067 RepID=B9M2Z6_GEODF|nr:phosphatase PAP2 family protein [Geotalea daltonii]ACM21342.1 membrane-associated phosphatase, PAP2_like_5 family [Geotalea daltonii FRC-32]
MQRLIYFLVMFLLISSPVMAEDNIFNSTTAIKDELGRLGEEAVQVAGAPFDRDALFGTLATAGAVGLTYYFDDDIRSKVLGLKGKNLDRVTDAGNLVGNPYLHLGVAAAVYGGGILAGSEKYRSLGEMLGESVILADAATFLLKEGFGRGRPFKSGDKADFKPLSFDTDYDSLPSMHTASSFAMASVMARTSESFSVKMLSYSAAAFVGFSRIYQDKHWASDVLLGAAIGELCGRVVTNYHAGKGASRLTIAPAASTDGASLVLLGKF